MRTVTSYSAGQFSGELLMIAGRKSIYRCQATETGTLLELSAKDLRTLIARDAELSDIFMKAFLEVLFVISNSDTAFWLSEVTHPYWAPHRTGSRCRPRESTGWKGRVRSLQRSLFR